MRVLYRTNPEEYNRQWANITKAIEDLHGMPFVHCAIIFMVYRGFDWTQVAKFLGLFPEELMNECLDMDDSQLSALQKTEDKMVRFYEAVDNNDMQAILVELDS